MITEKTLKKYRLQAWHTAKYDINPVKDLSILICSYFDNRFLPAAQKKKKKKTERMKEKKRQNNLKIKMSHKAH